MAAFTAYKLILHDYQSKIALKNLIEKFQSTLFYKHALHVRTPVEHMSICRKIYNVWLSIATVSCINVIVKPDKNSLGL